MDTHTVKITTSIEDVETAQPITTPTDNSSLASAALAVATNNHLKETLNALVNSQSNGSDSDLQMILNLINSLPSTLTSDNADAELQKIEDGLQNLLDNSTISKNSPQNVQTQLTSYSIDLVNLFDSYNNPTTQQQEAMHTIYSDVSNLLSRVPTESFPPLDPNDPTPPPSWFNSDIPDQWFKKNGYPAEDVTSKLSRMVQWMQDNPANKTAPQIFILFVSNLLNDKTMMAAHGADIERYLTTVTGKDADGNDENILDAIIDLEVQQKYFEDGLSTWSPTDFCNWMQGLFSSDKTISDSVTKKINSIETGWPAYVKAHSLNDGQASVDGLTPTSYATYCEGASKDWGNFLRTSNIQQWSNGIRSDVMDSLINQAKENNEWPPLYTLLALLFSGVDASSIDSIDGFGASAQWLTARTSDINSLENQWATGTQSSGPDFASWLQKLKDFQYQVGNNPITNNGPKSIGATVSTSIDTILGEKTVYSLTPGGATLTVGELYNKTPSGGTGEPVTVYNTTTGSSESASKALEDTGTSWELDPSGKTQPPAQYQTIMGVLKSIGSSVSSLSQTLTTQISQLSSWEQEDETLMNSALNGDQGAIGANKTFINNQISH